MTKKISTLFFCIFLYAFSFAQNPVNFPINFDSTNVSYVLTDFGGNASAIATDPVGGTNQTCKVTKTNTAQTWAGTTMGGNGLQSAVAFTASATKITMRVYSPDANIPVRMKVEDKNDPTKSVETEVNTTMKDAWETLTFNFANQASGTAALNLSYTYNKLSVFFNFGTTGATAGQKIYYCDDIIFLGGGGGPVLKQIDLPVTFDSSNVDYAMTDFGGNAYSLIADPKNPANKVAQVIKSNSAQLWAGTTIGTSFGFKNKVPFATGQTKMSVMVYSPDTGIAVRLKVEDPNDPTKSVETEAKTKVKDNWEILVFDFANQATGTAAINFGYTYQKASIFFNFGVTGATAGTKTYLFDNVMFGVGTLPPPPVKVDVIFKVDMKNKTIGATDTVTLNGTFNNWCGICTPMTKISGTNIWTVKVTLDTATEYEYKYTVGNWVVQETLAVALPCTKTTGAFTNRVIKTGSKNDSTIAMCWQSCSICGGTGIDERELEAIQMFPNPASKSLHFNFGQFTSKANEIKIYNVLGALVFEKNIENSDKLSTMDLDISTIKPGIYIVKLNMGGLEKAMKLQVQ